MAAPVVRFVSLGGVPLQVGPVSRERGSTWDGVAGAGAAAGVPIPINQLDRVAWHASNVLGTNGGGDPGFASVSGQVAIARSTRVLTDDDCQMIFQRCSDVRAAINSVSWRVATNDWDVQPTVPPTDPDHELAMAVCHEVREWLERPNQDDVWQELWTAVVADTLKFPAGVVEIATSSKGKNWTAEELVPVRGANFHPVTDDKGRVLVYAQTPWVSGGSVTAAQTGTVLLDPDRVVYLRIAATTESREPIPLLEALIYEICSVMQGNESISKMLNSNEVPEGILVLIGLSREAGERARAQYERNAGQPWKLRVITSQDKGEVDAKWVEFRKTAREQQVAELVKQIRRAIWRMFGVMPVEMGETDATPRATAEVQVDAGSSHLITPLLDLLETKINREVLPRRTEYSDLIRFKFKRARDLTPAERVSRATELSTYIKAGVLSRNQARMRLPEPEEPVVEGDVLTVGEGAGTIPLSEAIRARGTAPEDVPDELEPENTPDDDAEAEAEAEADDAEAEAESDAGDDLDELGKPRHGHPNPRMGRIGRKAGHRHQNPGKEWVARALRPDGPPAAWSPSGPFARARTLPLVRVWDEMTGYQRDILPLWEDARSAIMASVSAHYKASGFTSEIRQQVEAEIGNQMAALLAKWTAASAPRYRATAEAARVRASDWTGATTGDAQVQARADLYHARAMMYLSEPGGLLSDVKMRLLSTMAAVTDLRSMIAAPAGAGATVQEVRLARRAVGIGPEASLATVLAEVGSAFDAAVHRIGNWAGRLLELASMIASDEVVAGSGTGQADGIETPDPGESGSVDWWCEWANVGDGESCQTCRAMGGAGYMRVADLRVMPGGGTECRANCRCVLVYWTRAEIDGGTASLLGGGNTGHELSRRGRGVADR